MNSSIRRGILINSLLSIVVVLFFFISSIRGYLISENLSKALKNLNLINHYLANCEYEKTEEIEKSKDNILKLYKELKNVNIIGGNFESYIINPINDEEKMMSFHLELLKSYTNITNFQKENRIKFIIEAIISIVFLLFLIIRYFSMRLQIKNIVSNILTTIQENAKGNIGRKVVISEVNPEKLDECSKEVFENSNNKYCYFEKGTYAEHFGNKIKCNCLVDEVFKSCHDCKLYKELFKNELQTIGIWHNYFLEKLVNVIEILDKKSGFVMNSSGHLSSGLGDIMESIEEQIEVRTMLSMNLNELKETMEGVIENVRQQVNSIGATTSTLQEVSQSITQMADNTEYTMKIAENTLTEALVGGREISASLEEMRKIESIVRNIEGKVKNLGENSSEIEEIIEVIEGIAEQTNLLAFNAAIEAAHAGKYGKGFAVVADEIKELAVSSRVAIKEIEKLVKGIQRGIQDVIEATKEGDEELKKGSELSRSAEEKLGKIIKKIEITNKEVKAISSAMEEQATSITDISKSSDVILDGSSNIKFLAEKEVELLDAVEYSLDQVSKMEEKIAEAAKNSTISSIAVTDTANELDDLISNFSTIDDEKNLREINDED